MRRVPILIVMLGTLAFGQQKASIEGIVRDGGGKPLDQTDVLLAPLRCAPAAAPAPMPPPHNATTGLDGKFSFEDVDPGDCYMIAAIHRGYPSVEYPPQGPPSEFRQVVNSLKLTPGQRLTGVVIVLTRSVLSGKVTNEAGEPLAGVLVRALRPSDTMAIRPPGSMGGNQTDAQGDYKLTDLAAGDYYLAFSLPVKAGTQQSDYVTTYYPGVLNLGEAQVLAAVSGHDHAELNVRLRKVPVFHVRGKVSGLPDNVSLKDDEVRVFFAAPGGDLYPTQNNPGRKVAADGSFDYGGLTAGDWTLIVTAHSIVLYQRAIRIVDRNLDGLAVASTIPVDVSGQIRIVPELPTDSSFAKPIGLPDVVRLMPHDAVGRPTFAHVYPDGAFTAAGLGASSYSVEVDPPNGAFLKGVTFAGKDVMSSGLDFTEGTRKGKLELTVSLLAARVSGVVKDAAGKIAAGAVVQAIAGSTVTAQVTADGEGRFAMKVAPGKYRLYAWEGTPGAFRDFEGAALTLAEDDREQVMLTRIPKAK